MDLDRFLQAYRLWYDEPFPHGREDDMLDEIHAELAYADAMVADSAIPLAKYGRVSGNVPDQVRMELAAAIPQLDNYITAPNGRLRELALKYRRYIDMLQGVIDQLG